MHTAEGRTAPHLIDSDRVAGYFAQSPLRLHGSSVMLLNLVSDHGEMLISPHGSPGDYTQAAYAPT